MSLEFDFGTVPQRRRGRSCVGLSSAGILKIAQSSNSTSTRRERVVLGYLDNSFNPNENLNGSTSTQKSKLKNTGANSSRQSRSSSTSSSSSASSLGYSCLYNSSSCGASSSFSSSSSESSTTPRSHCRRSRRSSFPYYSSCASSLSSNGSDVPVPMSTSTTNTNKPVGGRISWTNTAFNIVNEKISDTNIVYGVIFSLSDRVFQEAERIMLVGTTMNELPLISMVSPGTPIFIYNSGTQRLHGGFEAASDGRKLIDPNAWLGLDVNDNTCPFPAQIRMRRVYACSALESNEFDKIVSIEHGVVQKLRLSQEEVSLLKNRYGIRNAAPSPLNQSRGCSCMSSSSYSSQESGGIESKSKCTTDVHTEQREDSLSFSSNSTIQECSVAPSSYSDIASVDTIEEELKEDERHQRSIDLLSNAIFKFTDHVDKAMSGLEGLTSYSGADAFALCANIQHLVRAIWPTASVEMYGSLSTGLWLPGQSDLDILINFQQYNVPAKSVLHFAPPPPPPPMWLMSEKNNTTPSLHLPALMQCHSVDVIGMDELDSAYYSDDEISTSSCGASTCTAPTNGGCYSQLEEIMRINNYHQSWVRFTNQLLLQGGDLELAEFPREEMLALLVQLHATLSMQPWCNNVKLIPSAMPVVKLFAVKPLPTLVRNQEQNIPSIPVDISILTNEHMGLQARDYISQVVSELPKIFRPLVLMLKQILREANLHDVYKGGLGSYSLSLMVIFFLQRCGFILKSSSGLIPDSVHHCQNQHVPRAKRVPMFHLPPVPLNQAPLKPANNVPNIVIPPTRPTSHTMDREERFNAHPPSVFLARRGMPMYSNETGTYCCAEEYITSCCGDEGIGNVEIPEELINAEKRIESVTAPVRAELRKKRRSVDRNPDVGLLLIAFLRLFSRTEDNGIDLSKVGIAVENGGFIYFHGGLHSLCIRDPVANKHLVGIGSFAMCEVQSLFSNLQKQLSKTPQNIFKFINCPGSEEHLLEVDEHSSNEEEKGCDGFSECEHISAASEASIIDEVKENVISLHEIKYEEQKKARAQSSPCIMYSIPEATNTEEVEGKKYIIEEVEFDFSEKNNSVVVQPTENEVMIDENSKKYDSDVESTQISDVSERISEKVETKTPPNSWASLISKGGTGKKTMATLSGVQCDSWTNTAKPTTATIPPSSESNSKVDKKSSMVTVIKKKVKNMAEKTDKKNWSKCLFIGNIAYYATDADLKKLEIDLAQFGKLLDKKQCLGRGSLWVTYESEAVALKALEHFDQKPFLKRPLYVDFSQKKKF